MQYQNFYQLFGLEPTYNVREIDLKKIYNDLLLKVHPDVHPEASDVEKRTLISLSADINEAYSVLSCPLKRGQYYLLLLKHHGQNPDRREHREGLDSKSNDSERKCVLPAGFLAEQMELREELDDIQGDRIAMLSFIGRMEETVNTLEDILVEKFDAIILKSNLQNNSEPNKESNQNSNHDINHENVNIDSEDYDFINRTLAKLQYFITLKSVAQSRL